jgi:hypothetical protein
MSDFDNQSVGGYMSPDDIYSQFGMDGRRTTFYPSEQPWRPYEIDGQNAKAPTARFANNSSPLFNLVYDGFDAPLASGQRLPRGAIEFIEKKFLPVFGVTGSRFSPLISVADFIFRSFDRDEPYMFLNDMPVQVIPEQFQHTYRRRDDRCVLRPDKIEVMRVMLGWTFPGYARVSDILHDPRVTAMIDGEQVWVPHLNRNALLDDVLESISLAVFGDYKGMAFHCEGYQDRYFDEMREPEEDYDLRGEMWTARENDHLFWRLVLLGLFTWLRSPYALPFMISWHPIYEQLLYIDDDTGQVKMDERSEGFAVVDGWTIYTGREIERSDEPPGTCCVSGQTVHCTQLVNSHAVKTPCACGNLRDMFQGDYDYGTGHNYPECQVWASAHPPHMVFVSFGALENITAGRAPNEPRTCRLLECPVDSCVFHQRHGSSRQLSDRERQQVSIHRLNEERSKMLTAPK